MSFYQTLQQATACERERLFNAPHHRGLPPRRHQP